MGIGVIAFIFGIPITLFLAKLLACYLGYRSYEKKSTAFKKQQVEAGKCAYPAASKALCGASPACNECLKDRGF